MAKKKIDFDATKDLSQNPDLAQILEVSVRNILAQFERIDLDVQTRAELAVTICANLLDGIIHPTHLVCKDDETVRTFASISRRPNGGGIGLQAYISKDVPTLKAHLSEDKTPLPPQDLPPIEGLEAAMIELLQAYQVAVDEKQETFMLNDRVCITAYIKHRLEFEADTHPEFKHYQKAYKDMLSQK